MLAYGLHNFIIIFYIIYDIAALFLNSAVVSEMTLPEFIATFHF